jgi:hypothetical protein
LSALDLERWLDAALVRRRAWGLLVPVVPLLCYALQPESPGSASSASFETTAWAASHAARPASTSCPKFVPGSPRPRCAGEGHVEPVPMGHSALGPSSTSVETRRGSLDRQRVSPTSEAPRPARDAADSAAPGDSAAPERDDPPSGADASLPAIDARSGPTGERLAVDALAAGDTARARALYAALANGARGNVAFAEAARILSTNRSAAPPARRREPDHAEER